MCGIAGVFAYGAVAPPVDEPSLLAVREHMRSRGPDGAGLWISADRRIGLAHRRLAVIDLTDGGRQPMHDPVSGNAIVFNGEIYNYRVLRAELEAAGHRFASNSDTEVLLKLYLVYGPEFLARVRGMYALALLDAAQKQLLLARDPFGIKPLYISDDGRTLRFASQVKALLAGGGVDERPDAAGHVGFFLWGHLPEPFTLYRGVRALPAGTSLVVRAHGARRERRHFDIAERTDSLEPLPGVKSQADAQEVLADAMRDTVRHHLVADVPVGVFLSSGLDSCTLLALARETNAGPISTFTLGFTEYKETEQDEVPLAEVSAGHYGSDQTSRWISREAFRQHFDRVLQSMDQPSIDGINTYFVCQAAHEAGLKVALSGLGGDELFAGYSEFTTIPKLVTMAAIPSRVPGLGSAFRHASAPVLKHFTSPKYAGLLEYGGDYPGAYLLRRGLFMPWELDRVLDPDLARTGWNELRSLSALRSSLPRTSNGRLKVGSLTSAWYMRNQLLRDADWASMAHSLELRTPLVDVTLWETVVRLVRGGYAVGKQEMARVPVVPLPPAILGRRKTGFSIPIREWLDSKASTHGAAMSRGLRGWAPLLYRRAGFGDLLAA